MGFVGLWFKEWSRHNLSRPSFGERELTLNLVALFFAGVAGTWEGVAAFLFLSLVAVAGDGGLPIPSRPLINRVKQCICDKLTEL